MTLNQTQAMGHEKYPYVHSSIPNFHPFRSTIRRFRYIYRLEVSRKYVLRPRSTHAW